MLANQKLSQYSLYSLKLTFLSNTFDQEMNVTADGFTCQVYE